MTQPTPKHDFVITHPKDDNGEEVKFSFMLTLKKQIQKETEEKLIEAIGTLDGIDSINPGVGRYTMAATIARTFDPDEVLDELKRRIKDDVLSDIVRPKIVTP